MDLRVKINRTVFENPVWVASGTFGNAEEFEDFLDLNKVGAIITKTITLNERAGNPSPRVVETPSGLLNSIGLENKGIERFKEDHFPFLKKLRTKFIISIAGATAEEYEKCVDELSGEFEPHAIEVNLSCPNVSHQGAKHKLFAQDPDVTGEMISRLRKRTKTTLIVKLTPNVTDITVIAKAAENAGADALALVNTYMGMAVDAQTMRPKIGKVIGGISGPAIKPLALKAVWDTFHAVRIPIIGIGGIMTGTDVAEFMLCGATAVQVGTANFIDPSSAERILSEFTEYLSQKKITDLASLIGKLQV